MKYSGYVVRSHHDSHEEGWPCRRPTMKKGKHKSAAQLGPGMAISSQKSIIVSWGPDFIDLAAFLKV